MPLHASLRSWSDSPQSVTDIFKTAWVLRLAPQWREDVDDFLDHQLPISTYPSSYHGPGHICNATWVGEKKKHTTNHRPVTSSFYFDNKFQENCWRCQSMSHNSMVKLLLSNFNLQRLSEFPILKNWWIPNATLWKHQFIVFEQKEQHKFKPLQLHNDFVTPYIHGTGQ